MKKNYVSNSEESIRMFKSSFLELFSKVHFTIPIIVYVPMIAYFCYKALVVDGLSFLLFGAYFILGLFVWSAAEYILHRFVFHYVPKGKTGLRLHFILHGVHHDYPSDRLRLVMPPSVSLILAVIFYYFFSLFFSLPHLHAFFPAFVLGYLVYDITHYAIHHFNFKGNFWKEVKRHHMLHHYSEPDKGYGVTSKLWDYIFQTTFKEQE